MYISNCLPFFLKKIVCDLFILVSLKKKGVANVGEREVGWFFFLITTITKTLIIIFQNYFKKRG